MLFCKTITLIKTLPNHDNKPPHELHVWCRTDTMWRGTHNMIFSVQVRRSNAAKYSDAFSNLSL
jgi:hypothetical protein